MNVAEAKSWLAFAASDLNAAETLLRTSPSYPRQVCFLAQQAAEKALKALLILLDIEFPFTHDLDRLRDLIPDGWPVKRAYPDLAELSVWAVEARYPGDMPDVLEVDAQRASKQARAIYMAISEAVAGYF